MSWNGYKGNGQVWIGNNIYKTLSSKFTLFKDVKDIKIFGKYINLRFVKSNDAKYG